MARVKDVCLPHHPCPGGASIPAPTGPEASALPQSHGPLIIIIYTYFLFYFIFSGFKCVNRIYSIAVLIFNMLPSICFKICGSEYFSLTLVFGCVFANY